MRLTSLADHHGVRFVLRFLVVFYATTTLLFFGFTSFWGVFDPAFRAGMAFFWPMSLVDDWEGLVLITGLFVALGDIAKNKTEVGN